MTISSEVASFAFKGNGTVGPYSVPFKVYDEDHVQVFVDGALQTVGTDYTVSGVGDDNFDITFVGPVGSNSTVGVGRVVPFLQETDYQSNDAFPAETHERALDLLVMMVQQVNAGNTGKAVRFPPTDAPTLTALLPAASARAGKILAFDSAGEVIAAEGVDFDLFSPANPHTWTARQEINVAPDTDGWVVSDQSGNTRAKFRRTSGGHGKMELRNDSGDITAVIAAADEDPMAEFLVPTNFDGVFVGALDGTARAKLRHRTDGLGALVVWDTGGNFGSVIGGAGDPEGSITADVGTLYLRSDGGAETSTYVKESGTGNTGWKALRTLGVDPTNSSGELTPAVNTTENVAHGLGARPRKVWGVWRCTTAEFGYAVGDEVAIEGELGGDNGTTVVADATNVSVVMGASPIRLIRKDNHNSVQGTVGNWVAVLRWEA